jgi:hypothetical protein
MIRSIPFSLCLLVLAAPCAWAQDAMPKELRDTIDKHLIGDWNAVTEYDGETMHGTYKVHWALGGECVSIQSDFAGSDGRIVGVGLVGWKADSKTLVHLAFGNKGDHFQIVYDKFDGNQWSGEVSGTRQGESYKGSAEVTWGEDRFDYSDTTLDKPFKATATRRIPEHLAWLDFLQGSWRVEWGGTWQMTFDRVTETTLRGHSPSRNFQALWTWDPSKKALVFLAAGGNRQEYTKFQDGAISGLSYNSTPNGPAHGNCMVQRLGPDKYRVTLRELTSDGGYSETSGVMTRIR